MLERVFSRSLSVSIITKSEVSRKADVDSGSSQINSFCAA